MVNNRHSHDPSDDGRLPPSSAPPVASLVCVRDDHREHGFAGALVDLALTLQNGSGDGFDALAEITTGAVGVIPGAEFAAVVVPVEPGRLAARAVQGALPPLLMGLQNTEGQGPCLDAVAQTERVQIREMSAEKRWPRFVPGAVALGVESMICTPLAVGNRVYGSLSLAATEPNAFTREAQSLASAFAVHAAIALTGLHTRQELSAALVSRDVIGQAKGILMERFGVAPDAAFALLVRLSQSLNIKLRLVCEQLCSTRSIPTRSDDHLTG